MTETELVSRTLAAQEDYIKLALPCIYRHV